MQPNILVIGLVPAPDFARFLGDLRARYPEALVTALIGNPELRSGESPADEYILWGDLPPRALAAELRRRHFALFVIAFNREYYFTLTYWKVLVLALLSRAGSVLFCEQAQLPKAARPLPHLGGLPLRVAWMWLSVVIRHLARLAAIVLLQLLFALLGALLLLPLLGIIVVDASVAVARLFARPRRSQASSR